MNTHLSPEEFVEAADGTLPAARISHLEACDVCATELAAVRGVLGELSGTAEVPEPSPLFWEHMAGRVRAVAAEPEVSIGWWQRLGWRHVAVAATVAAALAVVVMRPPAPVPVEPLSLTADAAPPDVWLPALEDESFDMVIDMASGLEWDEVRQVAAPRAGLADVLIQELSPSEREELVRLLRREMGELE